MAKRFAGSQSKAILSQFEALLRSARMQGDRKELRLLVTGKTGVGKSALVNGLLGKYVAVEGFGSERCTTEVAEYKAELHGVLVTVFDSPGLQDGTEKENDYLKDMREKCQSLSLVLYCTKMTNMRLKDEDKLAILKLTAAFGQKFWEHAVLVLTFANHENVSRRDDRDEDEGPEPDYDDEQGWKELKKKRFEGRLKKWKEGFYKFLIEEVGVTRHIVERILVVPAGDHKKSRENSTPLRLPDRDDWFSQFWMACCIRVKEIHLFFDINKDRLVVADKETIQICPHTAMDPIKMLLEEPLAHNHTLQLTSDAPSVDETYTTKLQENIKKMKKEREEAEESRRKKIKKQENKIKREERDIKERERQKMKDVEKVPVLVMQPNKEKNDSKSKDGAMAKTQSTSVKKLKKIFESQDECQPAFTPTKLRSTSSVSHLCHSTVPFPEIWAPDNHKELKLLVTGKTGVGKSTLVNGLLLMKRAAKEGARATRCTTEVTEYQAELHGVPVTVFDSPGLQDTTGNEDEYIADMKKKCQNLSLVLYCTKMTNNCLKDEDRYAILKLTAEFGQRFWEYAVLVLTFANHEDISRRDDRDDEGPEPPFDDAAAWKELEKKRFEGRLKKWKDDFHKFLIQEVGVTRDIVEKIPAVPAGDHRVTRENRTPLRLPGRETWFDEFWKACSLRMRGRSYQLKDLEHRIEMQAEERKRRELQKQAEEYKKKIDRLEKKKIAEESTQLQYLLLDKKPQKSDLLRIFKSSAAHYMIIGTALDVEVSDLLPTPGAAANHLILVFQRWMDSNNDVTWRKIVQVCEDYPQEFGQAKVRLERFFHERRKP